MENGKAIIVRRIAALVAVDDADARIAASGPAPI
jgi:hypothetical protein